MKTKKEKKKDKKKGKKQAFFDDDDDDDIVDPLHQSAPPEEVVPAESEEEEEEVAAGGSVFALLGGDGDDEEEEEEEEEDDGAMNGGSAFALLAEEEDDEDEEEDDDDEPVNAGSAFALLAGDDDDVEDEEEEEEEEVGKICIGEVASVSAHPKSKKLKVCDVFCGNDVGSKTVVTNVESIQSGQRVAIALAGSKTPGSGIDIQNAEVRGVMSCGMLCSGYDLGWEEEPDGVLAQIPSTLSVGDDCPTEKPEEDLIMEKKKKKKKKGKMAVESAFAALGLEEEEAPQEPKEEKKKKKKSSKLDFDQLLSETAESKEETKQEAVAEPPKSKKDKKKKNKKSEQKEEEEDLDAILAELGMDTPAENKKEEVPKQAEEKVDTSAVDSQQEQEGEEEQDESKMSAAAKKKARKKAKEKAKKAEAAAAAGSDEKKEKKPKMSAAVKKMQEALEARKKAEEEAARLAEEQRLREEEEERRLIEEEQRKKEEEERRKAEKAAKREQLRKEGKLLTAKQKAEQERLARAREQMLKAAGINPEELQAKKKPVYNKKKSQPKKSKTEMIQADIEQKAAEEPKKEEKPESPPPEPEEPKIEEEAADTWEDAADDWENMDEDEIKLPTVEEDELLKEEKKKAALQAKAAAKAKAAEENNKQSSDEESSDEEDDSESGSSDYSSSDYSDSDYSDSDDEAEREREERRLAQREKEEARLREALANRNPEDLRSPICCILGHVDTGKTKILDNIRRTNVQDGEAGGITQQIGATYIPADALQKRTEELRKGRAFDLKLPGLLVIDTPGHESFSNLRSRGSGLCDIAVLVVDLMHGLEQQTIESINLLKMRKTPFIIAMNKVDRIYQWKSVDNSPIQDALERQEPQCIKEFEQRMAEMVLQLNEQGLNVSLYWKNKNPRQFVNIVPTSAITGEGIPDLMQILVKMTQTLMVEKLMFVPNLQCTILEVKQIEGLGTTIDVILINGEIKEGDTIVVCGLNGPIVTTIRALLTPQPMKEIRVKGQYVHHKKLRAATGIKIAANGLENAVAGTQLFVAGADDDLEAVKDEVMEDMQDIFSSVDKTGEGVCVQASTLGSLEALLEFLKSDDVQIPVSTINIGPVHKKDVMRANIMIERKAKKFGVILAFDVPVTKEARELAEDLGVQIFTADIIYHLFDQFTAYLKNVKEEEQEAAKEKAVFPCVLRIMPEHIFNMKDPIIVGVEVLEGIAKVGTLLCVPSKGKITIGKIAGLEKEKGKPLQKAVTGDKVAMKIESTNPEEAARLYGRHFDHNDALVSRITRESIDVLKAMFRDEMSKDDWRLVIRLKKVFNID